VQRRSRRLSDNTLDKIERIINLLEKRPYRLEDIKKKTGIVNVSYYYFLARKLGYDVCRTRSGAASVYYICSDAKRAFSLLGRRYKHIGGGVFVAAV